MQPYRQFPFPCADAFSHTLREGLLDAKTVLILAQLSQACRRFVHEAFIPEIRLDDKHLAHARGSPRFWPAIFAALGHFRGIRKLAVINNDEAGVAVGTALALLGGGRSFPMLAELELRWWRGPQPQHVLLGGDDGSDDDDDVARDFHAPRAFMRLALHSVALHNPMLEVLRLDLAHSNSMVLLELFSFLPMLRILDVAVHTVLGFEMPARRSPFYPEVAHEDAGGTVDACPPPPRLLRNMFRQRSEHLLLPPHLDTLCLHIAPCYDSPYEYHEQPLLFIACCLQFTTLRVIDCDVRLRATPTQWMDDETLDSEAKFYLAQLREEHHPSQQHPHGGWVYTSTTRSTTTPSLPPPPDTRRKRGVKRRQQQFEERITMEYDQRWLPFRIDDEEEGEDTEVGKQEIVADKGLGWAKWNRHQ